MATAGRRHSPRAQADGDARLLLRGGPSCPMSCSRLTVSSASDGPSALAASFGGGPLRRADRPSHRARSPPRRPRSSSAGGKIGVTADGSSYDAKVDQIDLWPVDRRIALVACARSHRSMPRCSFFIHACGTVPAPVCCAAAGDTWPTVSTSRVPIALPRTMSWCPRFAGIRRSMASGCREAAARPDRRTIEGQDRRTKREHDLQAPPRAGQRMGRRRTTGPSPPRRPIVMWGTDMTATVTVAEGAAFVFVAASLRPHASGSMPPSAGPASSPGADPPGHPRTLRMHRLQA